MIGRLLARSLAALALLAGLMLVLSVPVSAQDMNCASFGSQAEAQAILKGTWPSDPNNLDGDADGVACQDYQYPAGTARDTTSLKATTDAAVPTGGTSTGFGGMAEELDPEGRDNRMILVGGGALALVGIGWTATRRRRHA